MKNLIVIFALLFAHSSLAQFKANIKYTNPKYASGSIATAPTEEALESHIERYKQAQSRLKWVGNVAYKVTKVPEVADEATLEMRTPAREVEEKYLEITIED